MSDFASPPRTLWLMESHGQMRILIWRLAMIELLPIVLAAILGAVIWRRTRGRTRLVLSIAAVVVSGTAATVFSGEFAESWMYILLDLGEAAIGLAVGFLIGHVLLRSPDITRAPSSEP